MVGASKSLEDEQRFVVSSCQTDKCAFSDTSSNDVGVLTKEESSSNPSEVVDSSDSVSPKQSPEKCLFSQADGVVESKQFECLQNNIITMFTIFVTIVIKLLLLLDGFLSGISVAVSESSTSFQNKRARFLSDAGSPEGNTSVGHNFPICFYDFSNGEDPQVFKVSVIEEVIETDIIDILDDEDVVVSQAILNNVILKEGKGPVIPSVSISSSEDNVKQAVDGDETESSSFSGVLQLKSPGAVINTFLPELCLDHGVISNAVSTDVTIDSIEFSFCS